MGTRLTFHVVLSLISGQAPPQFFLKIVGTGRQSYVVPSMSIIKRFHLTYRTEAQCTHPVSGIINNSILAAL